MMSWKEHLKMLRMQHGLKQSVVAEMLGVSQVTVSRWENGHCQPDLGTRRSLRDLLWKLGYKAELDIKHLMKSPIVNRVIFSLDETIIAISELQARKMDRDISNVVGKNLKKYRNDPVFDKLRREQFHIISACEFGGMRSVFFLGRISAGLRAIQFQ